MSSAQEVIVRFWALLSFLLTLTNMAVASDEGQVRLGVQSGHVGLLEDVGTTAGNALGFGALFGYGASDDMFFEIGYLGSSHTGLSHSELSTGVTFYFNSYDSAYFNFAGGVNFISHSLSNAGTSASGFAVYLGMGADFELGKKFVAGIQGLYHKAFDAKATKSDGSQVTAIQSYSTVLLRLMYVFGSN